MELFSELMPVNPGIVKGGTNFRLKRFFHYILSAMLTFYSKAIDSRSYSDAKSKYSMSDTYIDAVSSGSAEYREVPGCDEGGRWRQSSDKQIIRHAEVFVPNEFVPHD